MMLLGSMGCEQEKMRRGIQVCCTQPILKIHDALGRKLLNTFELHFQDG